MLLISGLAAMFAILIVAFLVFEVWMFVDALKNPKLTDTQKVLWCLGICLIHPIVAIVYYFVAYSKKDT